MPAINLTIQCRAIGEMVPHPCGIYDGLQMIALDVANVNGMAAGIAVEADPAYLVTQDSRRCLLDVIGRDFAKEYFGL